MSIKKVDPEAVESVETRERISVDITKDEKKALRIKVAQNDTNITSVVLELIRNYINN
jgi:hypothetical protein